MKKKIILSLLLISILTYFKFNQNIDNTRNKHTEFLSRSPFKNTLTMSKKDRMKNGIPPNKYFEREWELTMNPYLGKPTPEKLIEIKQDISSGYYSYSDNRTLKSVPGDSENFWIERGPNNVGGRVKAVLFDPNDPTNETVFAGSVSGGLWRNSNISNVNSSWELIKSTENISVSSITVDPNNSQNFYLGTGESYTSGDGIGSGVWKSSDGGNTWSQIFGGIEGEAEFQSDALLSVSSPTIIAGNYAAIKAGFGPELTNISGSLALVNDGSQIPEEGCSTLVNQSDINGKIAVINRGSCVFVDKVKNAQDAGAIAVLMINNVAGEPFVMSGDDPNNDIHIPSVMISLSDGQKIINTLSDSTVNVSISYRATIGSGVFLIPGKSHVNDVIAINNQNATEIYAAVGDSYYSSSSNPTVFGSNDVGVYKSIDGGSTWSKLYIPDYPGGDFYVPFDLEYSIDGSVWLSSTSSPLTGVGGGAIFNCTDGQNFILKHTITSGNRTDIAISKTNPNKIYVACSMNSTVTPVKLFKTTDKFNTFTEMTLPIDGALKPDDFTNGQSWYDLAIETDNLNDNTVYVGGIGWFKSVNAGDTWTQIATGYSGGGGSLIHPDQHGIMFATSNRFIAGNDGGVVFSNDAGSNFEHRISNLNITQFYDMAVANTYYGGEYFIAGSQDNGTQLTENATEGINSTVEAQGGDGAYCFFDNDGTDMYFISNYVYNKYITLHNMSSGNTIVINNENTSNGDFINQEAYDSNFNKLYSNYSSGTTYQIRRYNIFSVSGSGFITTSTLSNTLFDSDPTTLKVSPFTIDSSKLYVGLENGKILKVENANTSPIWSEISPNNMIGSISDIEFGTNENEIFVTIHNYGVNSVWFTDDGGATWQEKEGNLPDLPVKCILQNPLNIEQVIIGTELGTWWTQDFSSASPTWYQGINGMGTVKVTDLEMRDDYKVYAATYGRGIFSGQFTAADGTVGIKDEVIKTAFTLYPNPVNEILSISSSEIKLYQPNIKVYDINGRLIINKSLDNSTDKIELNVQNLSPGNYILKITSKGKTYTNKFIKTN